MMIQNSAEVIEEYKQYLIARMLTGTFDFNTWCQHQCVNVAPSIDVKPNIQFSVIEDKKSHK